MKKDTQNLVFVLTLAFSCVILYFNSLGNAFVFDDIHGISDNLYIKDLRYAGMFFKGCYTSVIDIPRGMLRPVLMLTFVFNYYFSGLQPFGFHVINLTIHFLNAILLYSLLKNLRPKVPFGLALLLSLLFIVHPVYTEAVGYISCRSDLLLTCFILLALLSYLRNRLLLSMILFSLALLTKESAVVFIPLVFVYDLLFSGLNQTDKAAAANAKRSRIAFYIIIIGLGILYWVYRGMVFDMGAKGILLAPVNSVVRSFWSNTFIQLFVVVFYLKLFCWPDPLNLHHVFTGLNSFLDPKVFLPAVFILALIILAVFLRKRKPLISLGVAWYLICLIPKFYAVLHYPAMEHHFYLPSLGIYFILAAVMERYFLLGRRKFIIAAAGILCVFALLSWFRNNDWKSNYSIYKSVLKISPDSAVAHNNLGIEYAKMGRAEAAEKEFKASLTLSNNIEVQVNGRINLAKIYSYQKKFDQALNEINSALKIKPNFAEIHRTWGEILINMGREKEAEKVWTNGLALNPQEVGILDSLGTLCVIQKRFGEAKDYFQAAIKYNPDYSVPYFALARTWEEEGNIDEAIKAYERTVDIDPASVLSHYALGTIYAQRLDKRALWHLREAARLAPNFAEAQNNLAILYASMDPPKLDLARKHAQNALKLGYPVEPGFLKILGISPATK